MEKTIYNGVKAIVLDASQLYCIPHISQRDEKKLDKLLNKQKSTSSQWSSSKITILKDIFRESKGSVYDYGLAETHDFGNFSAKLISLKENWENLCPGLYQWFSCDFIITRKNKREWLVLPKLYRICPSYQKI